MKAVLVDSSVVLDILTHDPVFYRRSLTALTQWGSTHQLGINIVVYSEVSVGFSRIEKLNRSLDGAGFVFFDLPREAAFLAGKAFLGYRRRGGNRLSPLPDFFMGAHAAITGFPLITRDPRRVRSAFPSVQIAEP